MPAELATSLTVTDDDLLMQAEQQVRDYCGWHIAPERTETLTLDGSGTSVMLLPTLRLTALAAVTEEAVDVDLTTIEWSVAGIIRRWCAWTSKYRGVTVSITHGYATTPADVAGVVRDIATRAKSGSGGLASKSVGPFSESYATDYPDEKAILDRYKLPPEAVMQTETVIILSPTTTTDRYGNTVEDWDNPTERPVVTLAPAEPRPSDEPVQDARNALVSGWTLYLPAGDPITSANRVNVRGEVYPVQGQPADWLGAGVVVQAYRTEG